MIPLAVGCGTHVQGGGAPEDGTGGKRDREEDDSGAGGAAVNSGGSASGGLSSANSGGDAGGGLGGAGGDEGEETGGTGGDAGEETGGTGGGPNQTELTVCDQDEFESRAPTATEDRQCTAVTSCSPEEFEEEAPSPTSDRVCTALTNCPAGTSAGPATETSDRLCSPCVGSYSTVENADTCIGWEVTCGDNEYVSAPPSDVADRVCAVCPSETFSNGPNAASCQGISAGWLHACTVDTADGVVRCWGDDSHGQSTVPNSLTGVSFQSVSAGGYHTCALRADTKKIECWGLNTQGQAAPINDFYQGVSAGGRHTCGHLETGGARCWGSLGTNVSPTGTFTKISAGGAGHACGLRVDGSISCFGDNVEGQDAVPSETFLDVAAWGFGACGLLEDHTPLCWGWETTSWAPLDGTFDSLSSAFNTVSTYPASLENPTLGNLYLCGMLSDGTLACNEDSFSPTVVAPMEVYRPSLEFTTVSLGKDFGCGIVKSDGLVACWGWDERVDKTGRYTPPSELAH